jgi:hypothetical protein
VSESANHIALPKPDAKGARDFPNVVNNHRTHRRNSFAHIFFIGAPKRAEKQRLLWLAVTSRGISLRFHDARRGLARRRH